MMGDYHMKKMSSQYNDIVEMDCLATSKSNKNISVNSENLDNFTDFLYWREPIGALDLGDIVLPPEPNTIKDNEIEKTQVSEVKPKSIDVNASSNPQNGKSKSSNKRKSKTNKKKNPPRVINNPQQNTISSACTFKEQGISNVLAKEK